MRQPDKLTVGVIFGGQSGEHEVSLVSAQAVMAGLDRKKYRVVPIGITKTGHWLIGTDAMKYLKTGKGSRYKEEAILPEVVKKRRQLPQSTIDVIFPVLHGPYGEDGTIQGLLELAHLPYVGAGVLGSACGMDKVIMKALFQNAKLPGPKYVPLTKSEWSKKRKDIISKIRSQIGFPNFTKPANLGSSVGIMKCRSLNETVRGLNTAFTYDRKALVEEAIDGREVECSVLGNNNPIASVPGEIVPNREFYDYEAKYIDGDSELLLPAPITPTQKKIVRQLAVKAFLAIDCAGLARVDFFIEKGTNRVLVNEINTLPGFTSISMYPKLWSASGLAYPKLLDRLITLALERHRERERIISSYQPSKNWYL
ncbi:MAG: D-alanine--D-alanine ligase family protein [Patescibacteria group bacterium]